MYFIKIVHLEDLCPKIHFYGIFSQFNLHNSFTIWFCTFLAWYVPIFIYSIRKSGFLSGCPVFQKVYIGNLHVMGCNRMQKFSGQNMSGVPFLTLIGHFQAFFSIHHVYIFSIIIRKYGFYVPDLGLIWNIFSLIGNTIACSGLL